MVVAEVSVHNSAPFTSTDASLGGALLGEFPQYPAQGEATPPPPKADTISRLPLPNLFPKPISDKTDYKENNNSKTIDDRSPV